MTPQIVIIIEPPPNGIVRRHVERTHIHALVISYTFAKSMWKEFSRAYEYMKYGFHTVDHSHHISAIRWITYIEIKVESTHFALPNASSWNPFVIATFVRNV